jgi:murein DD-endopeptidase MepM/ murein hydrolase activator NlpD
VTFVGHKFGFGLVVEVQHTPAVKTRYAHMRAATVKVGDQVARGDQLGTVGSSGITTGPHLHYEVLVRGKQVDPLRFVLPQPEEASAPAAPATSRDVSPTAGPAPAADSATPARVEQDSSKSQSESAAAAP